MESCLLLAGLPLVRQLHALQSPLIIEVSLDAFSRSINSLQRHTSQRINGNIIRDQETRKLSVTISELPSLRFEAALQISWWDRPIEILLRRTLSLSPPPRNPSTTTQPKATIIAILVFALMSPVSVVWRGPWLVAACMP